MHVGGANKVVLELVKISILKYIDKAGSIKMLKQCHLKLPANSIPIFIIVNACKFEAFLSVTLPWWRLKRHWGWLNTEHFYSQIYTIVVCNGKLIVWCCQIEKRNLSKAKTNTNNLRIRPAVIGSIGSNIIIWSNTNTNRWAELLHDFLTIILALFHQFH